MHAYHHKSNQSLCRELSCDSPTKAFFLKIFDLISNKFFTHKINICVTLGSKIFQHFEEKLLFPKVFHLDLIVGATLFIFPRIFTCCIDIVLKNSFNFYLSR
jgi:hypothetical protein